MLRHAKITLKFGEGADVIKVVIDCSLVSSNIARCLCEIIYLAIEALEYRRRLRFFGDFLPEYGFFL